MCSPPRQLTVTSFYVHAVHHVNSQLQAFMCMQSTTSTHGYKLLCAVHHINSQLQAFFFFFFFMGGGPRVVVSTAAFHARVRGSVPGLCGLKETKMYCGEPP